MSKSKNHLNSFFFLLQEGRRLNIILYLIVSFEPQSSYQAPLLSKPLIGPASW